MKWLVPRLFSCATQITQLAFLFPTETLKEIIERALEQDTLVFLDEDFLEFVENEKALSMINKIKSYPNLFILRSFTKIFGLTGLRVGYGIASEEIIDVLLCAKIPWNVNCLAQAAAVAALKDEEHLRVTRELNQKRENMSVGRIRENQIVQSLQARRQLFLYRHPQIRLNRNRIIQQAAGRGHFDSGLHFIQRT